jgi:chorismate--pyruvate lyase
LNFNLPFPIDLEAQWLKPSELSIADPSISDWLFHTESLTERLVAHTKRFTLQLIGEQSGFAQLHEIALLSDDPQELDPQSWICREVLLLGDNQPWVFARSIIPAELWQDSFNDLHTQPLGQRLFTDPRFQRQPFEVSHLLAPNPIFEKLSLGADSELWARRSIFLFNQYKMLVCEVFLPDSPIFSPMIEK